MDESPRLLFVGAHSAARGKHFPRHEHATWELVYYQRGRVRSPIGQEVYDASPGTLLATPPNTPHAEFALTGYANNFLVVDADPAHPWPRASFDDADRSLGRVVTALLRESADRPQYGEEMVHHLVAELDVLLRRSFAGRASSTAEQLVSEAERLFETRYPGGVRVADVAREVGASPSHLRAQFLAVRGCTPRAYLQGVRLRHALAHLRHSTLTLDTIAELVGFSSASHLSRAVKSETGMTPGAVRRTSTAHSGRAERDGG